jgi:hypothetical protein
VYITLTFHEARLTSMVCHCDCIYCATVTVFIVPVWLYLLCRYDCILYLCDCIYFASVTAFILPGWMYLLCQCDCIFYLCDCIYYASVTAFVLLTVIQLLYLYDCLCFVSRSTFIVPLWWHFHHCDLSCSRISVLVTEWLLFLYQQVCVCTSVNALVLSILLHLFCQRDCYCALWLHYLPATLLLQGRASRNDSWYTARSNHVMNAHCRITIQSYSRIKWNSDIIVWGEVPLPSFLPLPQSPHL